jgi:hypothetical protein
VPLTIQPFGISIQGTLTKSLTITDVSSPISYSYNKTITNGTTAGLADLIHIHRGSVVASGTPSTYDLSGALETIYGDACVFARLCGIIVVNQHATSILSVGAGSNPFVSWMGGTTPVRKVGPGGIDLNYNPSTAAWAVTADTGDILQVATDAGTSVPFDLILIGRSA